MPFTPPPPVPQRGARSTFAGAVDAFLKWMAGLPAQLDAFLARLETIAAGGAYAIPYTFASTAFSGLAGGGKLALYPSGNAQNAAATLYLDITTAGGSNIASLLDTFDDSTSAIKGRVRIVARNDPTKWLIANISAMSAPTALFRDIVISVVAASGANPFTSGDNLLLYFQPAGDKGDIGNADKKVQIAPAPVNGLVTCDYRNGNCIVWNPANGSTSALNITNWPAAGTLGEAWIIGSNLGSATVNVNNAVNWLRPDGTFATSASINTNQGVALRPSGEDNVFLWGRGGAPDRGQVAR